MLPKLSLLPAKNDYQINVTIVYNSLLKSERKYIEEHANKIAKLEIEVKSIKKQLAGLTGQTGKDTNDQDTGKDTNDQDR